MQKTICTQHLVLKTADPIFCEQLIEYLLRNREFLGPFEPLRDEEYFTTGQQRAFLLDEQQRMQEKQAFRFYIFCNECPNLLIGTIALSDIVWGSFESCFLGYKLDKEYLNRGFMTEAVQAVARFGFCELGLHRIEANILPRNAASLRVVQKAGFESEGLAKRYLKINGIWEDHLHMVFLNES